MRNPVLVALLFGGALVASYAESPGQSGWLWQNPSPQGNDLGGIHASTRGSLLLMGDMSTFLLSTNGGQDWNLMPGSGAEFKRFHTFQCIDPTTAYLSADSTLFKTTNGGIDWAPLLTGPIVASSFVNRQEGCVLTYSGLAGSTVLRTLDGGSSWTPQQLSAPLSQACMAFADSLHGWILGYQGELYATSDAGASWNDNGYAAYWGNLGLYFFDSNTGWLIGEAANICKTTNGGQSWTKQYTGNEWERLKGIYFKDAQQGWAWGPGLFLRTTNGGMSWSSQSRPVPNDIRAIQFADSSVGWAIGNRGTILRSTNGGASWSAQSRSVDASSLNSVQFVSENEGWTTGRSLSGTAGIVLHTTDGGQNWSRQASNLPGEVTSLYFMNRDSGWISTTSTDSHGVIYKTTDNGTTWIQKAEMATPLRGLQFRCNSTGWALGEGNVFKSTDAGESWMQQSTEFDTPFFQSCDFSDSLCGWVLALSATNGNRSVLVAKTTDGGTTWSRNTLSTSDDLRSVKFLNVRLGWAVGDDEMIYATTDGGLSWMLQHQSENSSGAALSTVSFVDSMHGWAAGGSENIGGVILQTTNGGRSWSRHVLSEWPILGLWFTDPKNGWAVGEGGTILKTTSGGVVLAVEQQLIALPEGYQLFQNYPNPFNPLTIIKYTIAGAGGSGLGG